MNENYGSVIYSPVSTHSGSSTNCQYGINHNCAKRTNLQVTTTDNSDELQYHVNAGMTKGGWSHCHVMGQKGGNQTYWSQYHLNKLNRQFTNKMHLSRTYPHVSLNYSRYVYSPDMSGAAIKQEVGNREVVEDSSIMCNCSSKFSYSSYMRLHPITQIHHDVTPENCHFSGTILTSHLFNDQMSQYRPMVSPSTGKRRRIAYKPDQVVLLLKEYSKSPYISTQKMLQLGRALNMSTKQVKVWFQNRRRKEKNEKQKPVSNEVTSSDNSVELDYINSVSSSISQNDPGRNITEEDPIVSGFGFAVIVSSDDM